MISRVLGYAENINQRLVIAVLIPRLFQFLIIKLFMFLVCKTMCVLSALCAPALNAVLFMSEPPCLNFGIIKGHFLLEMLVLSKEENQQKEIPTESQEHDTIIEKEPWGESGLLVKTVNQKSRKFISISV